MVHTIREVHLAFAIATPDGDSVSRSAGTAGRSATGQRVTFAAARTCGGNESTLGIYSRILATLLRIGLRKTLYERILRDFVGL